MAIFYVVVFAIVVVVEIVKLSVGVVLLSCCFYARARSASSELSKLISSRAPGARPAAPDSSKGCVEVHVHVFDPSRVHVNVFEQSWVHINLFEQAPVQIYLFEQRFSLFEQLVLFDFQD